MRHFLAFSVVVLSQLAVAPAHSEDLVTVTSKHSVAETAARLTEAVKAKGATVFAVVDHAAGAKSVGTELPPTRLVIFGNPALGTPLIAERRSVGLDLPIRVLIWQDDETVKLSYGDPAAMVRRHGLDDQSEAVKRIEAALDALTSGAVD